MSPAELLRATLFHTPANPFRDARALHCHTDGGLLVRDGRIVMAGDYHAVRSAASDAVTVDWRGGFLLPGLIDCHVHFPQLRIIGSLGRSLLDWLDQVALPEESRMADVAYARDTARGFVHALATHGTTTALVFGAHFAPATATLFEQAAARGLRIISGLVLSDRRLHPELHQSAADAYRDSTALIERFHRQGQLLYAVTPRFALSTSEAILEVCQTLCDEHDGLRVQSHLNENVDEVAEVRRLFPGAPDYLGVYERYGLIGPHAVMAHSVYSTDSELERLAAAQTSVAHCPASNAALGSGIFPFERHLAAGVHCALGTDVGGGTGFGILKEALQAYLMQRVIRGGVALDPARLLYLATGAGATALGLEHEIGDFRPGKSADVLYLRPPRESTCAAVLERADSPEQALAALFTLAGSESVREVRVAGTVVFRRHHEDDRPAGNPRPELRQEPQ
jgi:guanine deaminase